MKRVSKSALLSVLFILISIAIVYARAGGGGGGGGSSDDDSGIAGLVIYLLMALPFPYNILAIGVFILILFIFNKKKKQVSGLNRIPTVEATKTQDSSYQNFKSKNPSFDETKFKSKVQTAFMGIQKAWEAQDLSGVRKWISDGVYQRFTTQFKMMKILEQKNTLKDIQVKNIYIADVESDGNFDIIHVAIHAQMKDEFISAKYKNLNSGGLEEFVEFWSFIKKRSAVEKDLYSTNNCQNCGAEILPNSGELSKCEHCGTITNMGDYDWILSEITQADDYANHKKYHQKNAGLMHKIQNMLPKDEEFSSQFLEDKASNAYLQLMSSLVTQKPEQIRRFVNDRLYTQLSERMKGEVPFVFNRIYLNDVTLMDAYSHEDMNHLVFNIKVSSQKVKIQGDSALVVDPAVIAHNDIIVLSRKANSVIPKGHLYAHTCPSCGAPIADTKDNHCSYCQAEVNSPEFEWILTEWMPASNYSSFRESHKHELITGVSPEKLDALYDVRDYAFNNVLILISADGHFDQHENEFAHKLAKKWGYQPDKVQAMYEMAQNRKLVLRLPENPKKKQKVYDLMLKAAHLDGNVTPEEQAVLDEVKKELAA